ncbi:8-oxo-dGTP diphosphatase [Gammaproteobacteria bacterium]
MCTLLRVAVGVVVNTNGEFLVALRAAHRHQGGLWEFPGGKIEPGESTRMALDRELWEEFGIRVVNAHFFLRVPYQYPDRTVLLEVWRVTDYTGKPFGREGQTWRWVSSDALPMFSFPAANLPIVATLRIPSFYLITDSAPEQEFFSRLEQALTAGVRLIQLRLPGLNLEQYVALAKPAIALCRRFGAWLLLNCAPALAIFLEADGIHLSAAHLSTISDRPLPRPRWVAASCHNRDELTKACQIGADFVVLSPVLPTTSHPEAYPLGWETFAELIANLGMPVYALGGMTPDHLPLAHSHGARGIAVLSAVWKSTNIAETIRSMPDIFSPAQKIRNLIL